MARKQIEMNIDPDDRDAAIKHLTNIPYVGKKTAAILYDNGYKTIVQVQQADSTDLSMINGIGKKLGKRIKAGADELEIIEPAAELLDAEVPEDEPETTFDDDIEDEPEEEPTPEAEPERVSEEPPADEDRTETPGRDETEPEPEVEPPAPEKDAATILLQWQLDGYDVSSVEKMLFENETQQDEILERFKSNVEELGRLKEEISRREFPENMDKEVEQLCQLLNDPMKVDEVRDKLARLDGMKDVKLVEAEMEGIEGHEAEKEEIRKLLEGGDMAGAKKKLHRLRQREKEDFFASEFSKIMEEASEPIVKTKKVIVDRQPAVAKSREPMVVDAVFLTNAQGRPMSFRTRKPRSEVGMKWLKGAASAVRGQVMKSTGEPGEILEGVFEGHRIIVHRGELTYIGVLYRGQEHPLGRRMLKTALGVMEAKHYHDLKNWDGKSGVTSVGKSMNAIIPAFIKLNKLSRK